MNDKRRLLAYIILNIIVSSLSTLAVLWVWGRYNIPAKAAPQVNTNCLPAAEYDEIPPLDQQVVLVENVFGMADLQKEVVVIKRLGEGDLWLSGWKLSDGKGHTYTFPRLMLNAGGAIQIYTRTGTDSAISLYWGLAQPVWNSGSSVRLYDPLDQLRAEFKIP